MTIKHIAQRAGSVSIMLLGCIFLWAAISKISDLDAFANILRKMEWWLPGWILAVTLFTLPSLELIVGLCLLCKIAMKEALWVSILLLTIFTFVSVQSALAGIHGCNCFKIGGKSLFDGVSGWWIVARDVALTLACMAIALNPRNFANPKKTDDILSAAKPSSVQA